MRARKGHVGGFLPLLALPLVIKVLEEGVQEQENDIITWII